MQFLVLAKFDKSYFINNVGEGGVFTAYKNNITHKIWHLVTSKIHMLPLISGKL